ncbi:unnamed protein product [Lactuca saligna]|uniref:PHD-type domain-containing protein n=1 Tax=Lactuca saligna TaxID=75948 RepID=A0AA35ZDV0_LACSI|nr:unnamed protein product [Lactuca saligna]
MRRIEDEHNDVFHSDASTYCLLAKKCICVVHPSLLPPKPSSPFDLNLKYNSILEENNAFVTVNVSNNGEEIDEIRVKNGEKEDVDEDGILCALCQSTDGDPSNPIVFCDSCDLMVHTTCYGNPLIYGVLEGKQMVVPLIALRKTVVRVFDVICGLKEDLCIEYKERRNKGAIVARFYKSHSDLWMKNACSESYSGIPGISLK